MDLKRRVTMVSGTFFIAFAVGHVMQNADRMSARYTTLAAGLSTAGTTGAHAEPLAVPVAITTVAASATTSGTDLPLLPALPDAPTPELGNGLSLAPRIFGLDGDHAIPAPAADTAFDAFGIACTENLSAVPIPGAIIALSLKASCRPNAALVFYHAGISFSAVTSDKGELRLDIPAMEAPSVVTATFDDGLVLSATARVNDLADLSRIALQWDGPAALALHAMADGAVFGGPGHVSADAPRPDMGTMRRLGDAAAPLPMLVDIYTYPADGREMQIMIEAAVTQWNCGQQVAGATLMHQAGALAPVAKEVTFAMPGCDAEGQFVQMMPDLGPVRVAAN